MCKNRLYLVLFIVGDGLGLDLVKNVNYVFK